MRRPPLRALRRLLAWLVCLCPGAACAGTPPAGPLLAPLFQDHAVLQRDRPIELWGSTQPGRELKVSLGALSTQARGGKDGRWEARLPKLPAGGPYTLRVDDGTHTQSVQDVLIGDVWLCAGQSNMELPVWRALDAESELSQASMPTIRLLTVPQVASAVPLQEFSLPVAWQMADTKNLRDFSATCFFFARELQKTVKVPMGLIDASWGGSRIQAWIGAQELESESAYVEALDVLKAYATDPQSATEQWGRVWGRWWSERPGTPPGDQPWAATGTPTAEWHRAPPQLGPWEQWQVPALADFNGMVWFRAQVELSAAQVEQSAVLELGALDETDMTWVNGHGVGSRYDPGNPRRYALPAGRLQAGNNTIVINVLDTYRQGGMGAPASAYRLRFADGSSAALGPWEYQVAGPGTSPPSAPWLSAGGLTTLHNGMIAPLGRYGLRGALWYQGEANTEQPELYGSLLQHLRAGWRSQFGTRMPLLIVQLAGYGDSPSTPGESGWAGVREAQRRVAGTEDRKSVV